MNAAYITYQPDLAVPGAAETVEAFAAQAVASGVKRLVLLSGRGEEGALKGEQAVQNSGAEWTTIGASWFFQNFSESFFLEFVLSGEMALPTGQVQEPFVDADDIADLAVAALTENRHVNQLYDVTGPRLMKFADAAEEVSQATGRPFHSLPISADVFSAGLMKKGLPRDLIGMLSDLFSTTLDGRNSYLTDGVQRALGRVPRDFNKYAKDAAAGGVWSRTHDERTKPVQM